MNAEIVATLEKEYPPPVARGGDLDAMGEWLAQIEHTRSPEEMQERLAELNAFLAASPNTARFEAVIEPGGTSPRLSGKSVVLRLKP